ncbi:MAG TPA: TetR family transcriptional regulator [Polyangiales bacterium]|nr:TetR family transcriptional regulator [Polyangiales bacterium]
MRRTKADALETRQQILLAAEELFLREGVTNSTLEKIAAAANVTRGAIYWHFKDKYVLFEALYECAELPQAEIAARDLDREGAHPLAVLESCVIDCIRTVASDPRRQRICTIVLGRCEYIGPLQQVLGRIRESSERMHRTFLRGFQMAREQQSLDTKWTPDDAARVLNCLTVGIFGEWLGWDEPSGSPADYERMVRELFTTFHAAR